MTSVNALIASENMDDVTIDEQVKASEYHNDSITFDYELSNKGAKSKLLKGSKRMPLKIEENSTSSNLVFSVGAWLTTVLPAVRYWNEIEYQKTCTAGDITIKVMGIKSGKDVNGMHVVSKVVFYANRDKIVCHLYNTTQLILVNGHGYKKFIDVFLRPFFDSKILACNMEIQNLNEEVAEKFGPKTVKRGSWKSKRGSLFPCIKCELPFKNMTSLKKHNENKHALSINVSQDNFEPRQSTRNNSLTGSAILVDLNNVSIRSRVDDVDLSVIPAIVNNVEDERLMIEDITLNTDAEKNVQDSRMERSPDDELNSQNSTVLEQEAIDVNMETWHSCDKCEFECENKMDLAKHMDINIHSVKNLNKTLGKNSACTDKILNCHMCEYKAIGLRNLLDHGKESHNIIKCKRCEYWAEDEDIMNNHMKKHTGEMIFSCYGCEFETTREHLLENHNERRHKKVEVLPEPSEPDCSICEESFPYNFLVKSHKCTPKSKFACQGCAFMSVDLNELVTHAREHIQMNNIFNCDRCAFVANNEAEVKNHVQVIHKTLQVDLKEKIEIPCDQCDFKCYLNIQLKKHKKSVHKDLPQDMKYQCSLCDICSGYILHLWEHVAQSHPDQIPNFNPKSKDMVSALIAEQKLNILEEVETLKKDIKGSLAEFTDVMATCLETLKDDIIESTRSDM